MKKILLLMTFIFCLFAPSVKAYSDTNVSKPFVCTVGYDYSDLLIYDGYEIISKAVDFNNVGVYYISYLNKTTKETVVKRVEVINENSIYEGGYYRASEVELVSPDYVTKDVFTFNEDTYLLEDELVSENSHNLVLTKISNNNIVLTKVVKTNLCATFNKILVDEGGIYIIGTIYKEGYSTDIYMLKVDFSFNILFENTIGGLGVESFSDALLYGDYIYLVGNTTSSGGYFSGTRKQEDSYLMKVTKDLFNVEKVSVSTLSYINSYVNISIKDDYLYLLEQYSNGESIMYTVKTFTLDLVVNSSKSFLNSHALTPTKLVSNDEGMYLLCYQYNYLLEEYASRIYELKDDASVTLYFDYTNYEDENTRIVDLTFNERQMVVLTYDYNLNKVKLILKDLKTKDVSTLSVSSVEPLAFTTSNCYLTYDHSLVNYIYIKSFNNDLMFINDKCVKMSENSNLTLNKNIFGSYQNTYLYETDDLLFALATTEYVPVEVSVINNETFDKNLCLTFNGKGYLNGTEIGSGYIIDKVGTYQLEVYGNNNERKVYEFDVAELSNKEVKSNEDATLLEKEEIIRESNKEMTLLYSEHINNETTKTYFFFLLLIPLILLTLSLVLVFRRKHEK